MTDLTDDIYWASKPPEVRGLQGVAPTEREAAAQALAAQGFIIDRAIDIYGWDPTKVMAYRLSLGVTSQLSAFAPVRAILVSLDAADYKPFDAPAPPLPKVRPVGEYIGNGLYRANITACIDPNGHLLFADQQHYSQDGVEYIFHETQFWGVPSINWSRA